jgi:hypothetical protein
MSFAGSCLGTIVTGSPEIRDWLYLQALGEAEDAAVTSHWGSWSAPAWSALMVV